MKIEEVDPEDEDKERQDYSVQICQVKITKIKVCLLIYDLRSTMRLIIISFLVNKFMILPLQS